MEDGFDTIDYRIIHRPGELDADGDGKTERFSVDFIVNGPSLYEMVGVGAQDLIGRFSPDTMEWNTDSASIFYCEKSADLENGRTMLFVCPECGDIGCGAITIKIEMVDGRFTWSEFGYENNYDPEMTESYDDIGPFTFKSEDYLRVISEAVSAKS